MEDPIELAETYVATLRVGEPATSARPVTAAPLERGAAVGRYIVLDRLGEGGMGVVYAAYDPELDRRVALKLLRVSGGGGEERTRLLREAQAMARLQHPHIVAVYDVGVLGERVWTAMELVEGETLKVWLGRRPRGWAAVLTILLDVASGLQAAHAAGLVHRDIKPDNLMIGGDGRVRVVDFGLARSQGEEAPGRRRWELRDLEIEASSNITGVSRDALLSELTRAGSLVGTPAYMAPEQFLGEAGDARCDQFAWCVTCWEAIFGERPFTGENLGELVMAVSCGRLRAPPPGRCPRWLQRALERGLQSDPGARFPDMGALVAALEGGRRRDHRRRWCVGVLAGLGVVGGLVGGHELRQEVAREACHDEAAALGAALWRGEDAAVIRGAFAASGAPYAAKAADRSVASLDRYRGDWVEAVAAVCVAALDGGEAAEEAALARGCLEERRLALATLAELLREADPGVIERAVVAAASLPAIDACRDPLELARRRRSAAVEGTAEGTAEATAEAQVATARLREAVVHAAGLVGAGRGAQAVEELGRVLPELAGGGEPGDATDLEDVEDVEDGEDGEDGERAAGAAGGDRRLWAEAALVAASALFQVDRFVEAEARALGAVEHSLRVGDDVLAVHGITVMIRLCRQRDALDEALRWAALARALLGRLGGEDGAYASEFYLVVGDLHSVRGEFDRARELVERALAIERRILGEAHPQVGLSLNALGIIHEELADYDAAARLYGEARRILGEALGEAHPAIAKVEENLGNIAWSRGELDLALGHQERALAIRRGAYGPDHASVSLSHLNLGNVHFSRGDLDTAAAAYRQAMAVASAALGPESLRVAYAQLNLSEVLTLQGELGGARELLERALAIRVAALGRGHSDVAFVLSNRGEVELAAGELDLAAADFAEALGIWERSLGLEHPYAAGALLGLGRVAYAQGELEAARGHLERALESASRRHEGDGPAHLALLIVLARVELAAGESRRGEALATAERAFALIEAEAASTSPRLRAAVLEVFARAAVAAGDRGRARALAEEALTLVRTDPAPAHGVEAFDRSELAAWLAGGLESSAAAGERRRE